MPLTLLIVGFLCMILIIANRTDDAPAMRRGLFTFLTLTNLGFLFAFGVVPLLNLGQARYPRPVGILALSASAVVCCLCFGLMIERVRFNLRRLFPPTYNPSSLPQMVAMIFCVYLVAQTALEFILAGGLTGLAENFSGVNIESIGTQLAVWIVIAFFGVGFPARRTFPAALARLGLRAPTIEELAIAWVVAIGLVIMAFMVGALWTMLTPRDVLDQQTQVSRLISLSVDNLTFAFIVALAAAVGEEIAFRGALQPVFGLWPTAIFFALTHIQYALTPATLLIIVVGLGLGWVRKRYNTTASILTHFMYNFALLSLSIYARYLQDVLTR